MTLTPAFLLLLVGLILLILSAAGTRVPWWASVLCLFLVHLLGWR